MNRTEDLKIHMRKGSAMDTPLYEIQCGIGRGNRLYVKRDDLLPFSLGGNKVRIGWEFYRDMCRTGSDCMVIYGDSRSNLCRVLGSICHQKRIPCYMLCTNVEHTGRPASNSRLMKWLHTEVVPCRKDAVAQGVEELLIRLEKEGRKPYYIYGNKWGEGREGVPVQAYADAYREILRQEEEMGVHFSHIFVPSGTGATHSGLIAGDLLAGGKKQIIGISVSRERKRGSRIISRAVQQYFESRGLDQPDQLERSIHLEDGYLLGGYGKYDERIEDCIRRQFTLNSLPLDPTYTGKAFWGMEQYLQAHGIEDADILFIHTGGAPLFYDHLTDEKGGAAPC